MDKKKSTSADRCIDEKMCRKSSDNAVKRRCTIQNFRLIWLDTNINNDYRHSINHLQHIVNTVDTFTDADQCVDFLTEIRDEKAFMIVSGDLGQEIIPHIHDVFQLDSIYVFCREKSGQKQWTKNWSKVKGVYTDIDSIYEPLKRAARRCDQNSISLGFVSSSDTSNPNLDQLDQSFMYTQLLKEILLELNHNEQSLSELAVYCREQYADNEYELNKIEKFQEDYHLQSPIWWYTCEYFLYYMLNRALRTQEVDTIIKMGFFIRDVHRHIEKLHAEQINDYQARSSFTVYRGQGLTQKDFEKMMETKGGLMSFNNFLSTSKDRDVSFAFAESNGSNPDLIGILFEITIDPSVSSAPFAHLDNVSYYKEEEKEILFSMHTVFRIGDIKQLDDNGRVWQVQLKLTSDNDQQLNALTEQMRKETAEGANGWLRLGFLLVDLGELARAEQVYRTLLDQASNNDEKARLYQYLADVKVHQGDNLAAIAFYENALDIFQKTHPPTHRCLTIIHNISIVYSKMGKYLKALRSLEKVLDIRQKTLPSGHPDLVSSYGNIGIVYHNMGKYSKALSFLQQALEIIQKTLPPNHPDLAGSYCNIGMIYQSMGQSSKALPYYEKTLEIFQKILPPNHPKLAESYTNIGAIYDAMGEYSKALSYYEEALEIFQKTLSSNHPDVAACYNNIGNVHGQKGDYPQALSSYIKGFEILKKTLPPNYPDLAMSYINIGTVYDRMGQYVQALILYKHAVEIGQRSLTENHPILRGYRKKLEDLIRKL